MGMQSVSYAFLNALLLVFYAFLFVKRGQRIFPVGGREYQEYSVIFAQ